MRHSNKFRTFRLAAILTLAATTLAACATGTTDAGEETGGEGEALTIGFVFNTATDPNQQTMLAGIQAAAEAEGWTVNDVDPNGDATRANNLITTFVTQGVDVIVTTVFPPSALRQGIAAAEEAGIPVVATYAFGEEAGVAAVVTATAGTQQAERMVADLGGEGSVLAFTFQPGQPCIEAEAALDSVLAENPGITVQKQEVPAPGWEQAGLQATSSWLRSNPEGSQNLAVWGCWDGPALGAIAALQQEGRDDVRVYGQYGEAGALAAVQAGTMTATYWFDNDVAGAQTVAAIAEIVAAGDAWEPTQIFLDPVEVDASSVEQFLADNPGLLGN